LVEGIQGDVGVLIFIRKYFSTICSVSSCLMMVLNFQSKGNRPMDSVSVFNCH
jgi:hypothetical protein